MLLWQHPCLKRKAWRIRRKRQKRLVLAHHAHACIRLLADDVTEHAAFFVLVVFLRSLELLQHMFRHDGQRDQLAVRMLQRRSRRRTVVLKDHDVFEPLVLLQVEDAVAEGPQHILDALLRQRGQRGVVLGRLDDDLVRPDARHLIEHAYGGTVQTSFDAERWELIGDHAHRPALCIAACAVGPVRQNLGGRLALITRTKRAKAALHFDRLAHKIGWALRAISRYDDPSSNDGIFAQFWHWGLVSWDASDILRYRRALQK